MPYTYLSDWDFKRQHVQPGDMANGHDFVSSESIVVCAIDWAGVTGSNTIDDVVVGGDTLIPIGLLENATIVQNKQLQQLFEIGSRIPFMIPGRTYIQVNLARLLFNGHSLLAALYPNRDSSSFTADDMPGGRYTRDSEVQPFNFYANLASTFFNSPTHLAFILNDSEDQPTGAIILRDAYVQNQQMSITGQQTIVLENATIRCSRVDTLEVNVEI